jgi:diguanylate cyclase (GGDEF)-like protein
MTSDDQGPTLFQKLRAAKRLPSPPGTALKVIELCRCDDVDIQAIADVIKADPALSGRLLKFANSPMAGLEREVTSVRSAILLLGLRTVKLTALGFSLATPGHPPACEGFSLKTFWSKSFVTASIARRLAEEFFDIDREEAFTVGMLARIGQLALTQGLPEEYTTVLEAVNGGADLIESERDILGVDHVMFGAQLLEDWDLPEALVRAVGGQLLDRDGNSPDDALPQAKIIHVARNLTPVFLGADAEAGSDVRKTARELIEQELKLDEPSWKRISEEILTEYMQVAEVFDVRLESTSSVLDLYAEAQEQATRVGMVAQIEQTQTLKDNHRLLRQATVDKLTGAANRAKFDEKVQELTKGARRGHGDFALIMFDIDHFKKFNDTYGHQTGDLVLKRVAVAVGNTLREVDLLARYGGEEFAVLLPQTDRKGSCVVAARIRRCVEELRIAVNGETLGVTVSLGLAITTDYPSVPDSEKLIADADEQLYRSKDAGRNTWSYLGRTASNLVSAPPASAATPSR